MTTNIKAVVEFIKKEFAPYNNYTCYNCGSKVGMINIIADIPTPLKECWSNEEISTVADLKKAMTCDTRWKCDNCWNWDDIKLSEE